MKNDSSSRSLESEKKVRDDELEATSGGLRNNDGYLITTWGYSCKKQKKRDGWGCKTCWNCVHYNRSGSYCKINNSQTKNSNNNITIEF